MGDFIVALPMYDWPENRAEVDAEWATIRDALRHAGVDAPTALTRDYAGLHELWQRPNLLFAQACWGPLEQGLAVRVQVIGQPDYSEFDGGAGELYSSAIVMRALPSQLWEGSDNVAVRDGGQEARGYTSAPTLSVDPPKKGEGKAAAIPIHLLRNTRLAFNSLDSMSGILALGRDLEAMGESLAVFSERIETGGHRKSIQAVAESRADVAAIDCKSWALAKRHEPATDKLQVVGWTAQRKGLPFITAGNTPPELAEILRDVLVQTGKALAA